MYFQLFEGNGWTIIYAMCEFLVLHCSFLRAGSPITFTKLGRSVLKGFWVLNFTQTIRSGRL